MTLATGEAADLAELLAVSPGCQLRIRVVRGLQPWTVTGLHEGSCSCDVRLYALMILMMCPRCGLVLPWQHTSEKPFNVSLRLCFPNDCIGL